VRHWREFLEVVFFAAAHWLMRHMRLGRAIYALGGDANATRLSGVKVKRTQLCALVIARFMTAVGAANKAQFRLAQLRRRPGTPGDRGAAVIGGASPAGGRGDVRASLFGALTIVLAVGIDMWRDGLSRILSSITLFARPRGAMARDDADREGEQK
jgi:ribose transport system permease protein